MMSAASWRVRRRAPREALAGLGVGSELLAQLLLNRGVTTPAEATEFLDGQTDRGDPWTLAGMGEAVDRIRRAIREGERIVVYGDYDVDGLSGATMVETALREAGGNVSVFVPHRARDGYGLNAAVLAALRAERASLVVSVDCGISAAEEIASAHQAGLDVVVTDHHQVPARLPDARAVVNPHRPDCPYPFKHLAGAGVALRLAQAILHETSRAAPDAALEDRLYQLAALGTIADVMPLVGENRAIVRRGLRVMNERPSPGLAALIERAKSRPGDVTAATVAYRLAPRLNAAGRVDDAVVAHRLLAARHETEASAIAERLEALNTHRRSLTEDALERARLEISDEPRLAEGAVVISGDYPLGVLGLVAARLSEQWSRPAALNRHDPGEGRGSVRSVPGVDALALVSDCAGLLRAYGGHAGAAGFSIDPEQVEAFRTRFQQAAAARSPSVEPREALEADCRLRPERVGPELCDLLDRLEPCGEGNPTPVFESRDLVVSDVRIVGSKHVRLSLRGDGAPLAGVRFNVGDEIPTAGARLDVLYHVRRKRWRESYSVELELLGWRPSAR